MAIFPILRNLHSIFSWRWTGLHFHNIVSRFLFLPSFSRAIVSVLIGAGILTGVGGVTLSFYLFVLLFPGLLEFSPRVHHCSQHHGAHSLCFHLCTLWIYIYHSGLIHFEWTSVCIVWEDDPVSFFGMWGSHFPSAVYEEIFSFLHFILLALVS